MKQNDVATFTRIFTLYSYEYHIWDVKFSYYVVSASRSWEI